MPYNHKLLAQELAEQGLSYRELARECGLSDVQVARIVRGECDPKVGSLVRVCRVLGVEVGKVVSGS